MDKQAKTKAPPQDEAAGRPAARQSAASPATPQNTRSVPSHPRLHAQDLAALGWHHLQPPAAAAAAAAAALPCEHAQHISEQSGRAGRQGARGVWGRAGQRNRSWLAFSELWLSLLSKQRATTQAAQAVVTEHK